MTDTGAALLAIDDLHVRFRVGDAQVAAVNGVTLDVSAGESLGIVGESGSGKSVTAMSILRLLRGATVTGRIGFAGRDLLALDEKELRRVRGGRIGMVFQDPLSSLNPTQSIGRQISEVVETHLGLSRHDAMRRATELLERVGIANARGHLSDIPHQFSGGMRQRVMIAMAVSCNPKLLIADEPTTALDVTTQAQVIDLLKSLQEELGMALIMITHDFGVVKEIAQRVAVMYGGTVVETGDLGRIAEQPWHPYTQALLRSVPSLDDDRHERLGSIGGSPPNALALPPGCPFAPRCEFVLDVCHTEKPPERPAGSGYARCWLEARPTAARAPRARSRAEGMSRTEQLLEVENLTVVYGGRRSGLARRRGADVRAVDDVSFTMARGETLGLVGESGSGKSTTGRAILRLVETQSGRIGVDGVDVGSLPASGLRDLARDVKIIFQDSLASLDPRMTVRELVEEPLHIHAEGDRGSRLDRVREVLSLVGLGDSFLGRYAHELSGGQRQRVGVARSLVLSPKLVICDEPVSALDVSVQAQVVNLFHELRERLALTLLFISHDLRVVRHLADRIAVMYGGRIVELAPTDELFESPKHPYTQLLLASVPESPLRALRASFEREPEAPVTGGDRCVFAGRCPHVQERCRSEAPPLEPGGSALVACHFWEELSAVGVATVGSVAE
jgi:peptide/nickel transport system ATP-binding protein